MSEIAKAASRSEIDLAAHRREPTAQEGLRLLEAFRAIDCPVTRAQILQLLESLPVKVHASSGAA